MTDQRITEVLLLDDPTTVSMYPVYLIIVKEFVRLMSDYKIGVRIVTNTKDIHNNALVFVGDKFNCNNPAEEISKYAPEAVYCLWYWHDIQCSSIKNIIHLHENYIDWTKDERIVKIKSFPYSFPMIWLAPEDPSKVGTYSRNVVRDYFFAGWHYRKEWVPDVSSGFNGIYFSPDEQKDYLSYETRRELYLSSHFALGFHADYTIEVKSVSQRVFEGFAYGCIVLTDSDAAVSQTEGIAVRVYSKEHLIETMKNFLENPEEMERRRQLGYEFVKRCGTSYTSIQNILNIVSKVVDCDRSEIFNGMFISHTENKM